MSTKDKNPLLTFLKSILSIRKGTNFTGTIEGIHRDLIFKGHSVWILACSIFIASIGLNLNSTAVVIGAMLISPLMGPILGIGLSVGTYDWKTLIKSLKNFAVMVFVALLTSAIYFWITPIQEASSELLGRTKPTFLDVLIAIAGGIAGIVAGSRSEKSNVIPGVAIATALMPPLCTAGYGLALGNMQYFIGAMYLFFINTVFISFSTVIVVRYLGFPIVHYLEPKVEKRLNQYMTIFIIAVLIPSAFLFFEVISEARFNTKAKEYVKENFSQYDLIDQKITYDSEKGSEIDLYFLSNPISENVKIELEEKLTQYDLENTNLRIHQAKAKNINVGELSKAVKIGILEEIYQKNEATILNKDSQILILKKQLLNYEAQKIPLKNIEQELKIQYPKLKYFAFSNAVYCNFENQMDTVPTFMLQWEKNLYRSQRKAQEKQMENWLKVRLELDTLTILNY